MCGGIGFLIGTIVFFGWYKSEARWKKGIAITCGVWMTLSALVYVLYLFA